MKKLLFLFAAMTASIVMGQDLPTNPEPGKCYVRCTTPDVYVNETVTLTIKPAYKILKTVPATFKTVTESVEVKAAGKTLTVIPEKWGTETVTYVSNLVIQMIVDTGVTKGILLNLRQFKHLL